MTLPKQETPSVVRDSIGAGIEVQLFQSEVRGCVSVVLVDNATGRPIGPSAEVQGSELARAVASLGYVKGRGRPAPGRS